MALLISRWGSTVWLEKLLSLLPIPFYRWLRNLLYVDLIASHDFYSRTMIESYAIENVLRDWGCFPALN